MKLDKIRFASLIGFISSRYALTVTQDDIAEMDQLIIFDIPEAAQPEKVYPLNSQIEQLMAVMDHEEAKELRDWLIKQYPLKDIK